MRLRTAVLAAALLAACAHGPRPAQEPPGQPPRPAPERAEQPAPAPRAPGPEEGLASYYARSLRGRRTASGARYDPRAMTCAHRTAAFGTTLRVTDLETGRSVLVRVNDRGPFVEGRVVDLSWAAAHRLGITQRGLARVRIERVPQEPPAPSS